MPAFVTFGRILFAVLFIYTGATKLFAIQATADFIATRVVVPDVIAPYAKQVETATAMTTPDQTTKILRLPARSESQPPSMAVAIMPTVYSRIR